MESTSSGLIKSWIEESRQAVMEYSYSNESEDGYRRESGTKVGMRGGFNGFAKAVGFIQRARSLQPSIPAQERMEGDRGYIDRVCDWCDANQKAFVDLNEVQNEQSALRLCKSFETYAMPSESQVLIWYLRGYADQWTS